MRLLLPVLLCAVMLLTMAGCGAPDAGEEETSVAPPAAATVPAPETAQEQQPELLLNPTTEDLLPDEFKPLWQPWVGDYDAIVERRVLRVLTPIGGYQFYFHNGRPRGATFEMLVRLEAFINEELGKRNVRVYVVPIAVSRDQLIPGLVEGLGDLIATDLTITPEREQQVAFTRPLLTDIREVVVVGPTAPALGTLDDLAGKEIFVRPTSSYAESLRKLQTSFTARGLKPPVIVPADEILEAEDLLDLLQAGIADMTVMDEYKAMFWETVMEDIDVRSDLAIAEGGSIAWAHRKEDEQLAALLERFMRKFGKGTAFGNDVYRRYLQRPDRVRCAGSPESYEKILPIVRLLQRYGDEYGIEWLRLAAQGYQESGLRQDRRSPAGAIGIMQIKPSTAADRNVGIDDVTTAENNIHAGAKYMRFITDRYFDDADIDDIDRWFFSLAAYNAGPAKIARFRREAREQDFDPNKWFNNVEIIAARRIGRETVTYVSNIYRYYLMYQLIMARGAVTMDRYRDTLTFCRSEPARAAPR
jgi:membrane-bound lytic murein transglycosylase MltF